MYNIFSIMYMISKRKVSSVATKSFINNDFNFELKNGRGWISKFSSSTPWNPHYNNKFLPLINPNLKWKPISAQMLYPVAIIFTVQVLVVAYHIFCTFYVAHRVNNPLFWIPAKVFHRIPQPKPNSIAMHSDILSHLAYIRHDILWVKWPK